MWYRISASFGVRNYDTLMNEYGKALINFETRILNDGGMEIKIDSVNELFALAKSFEQYAIVDGITVQYMDDKPNLYINDQML